MLEADKKRAEESAAAHLAHSHGHHAHHGGSTAESHNQHHHHHQIAEKYREISSAIDEPRQRTDGDGSLHVSLTVVSMCDHAQHRFP